MRSLSSFKNLFQQAPRSTSSAEGSGVPTQQGIRVLCPGALYVKSIQDAPLFFEHGTRMLFATLPSAGIPEALEAFIARHKEGFYKEIAADYPAIEVSALRQDIDEIRAKLELALPEASFAHEELEPREILIDRALMMSEALFRIWDVPDMPFYWAFRLNRVKDSPARGKHHHRTPHIVWNILGKRTAPEPPVKLGIDQQQLTMMKEGVVHHAPGDPGDESWRAVMIWAPPVAKAGNPGSAGSEFQKLTRVF